MFITIFLLLLLFFFFLLLFLINFSIIIINNIFIILIFFWLLKLLLLLLLLMLLLLLLQLSRINLSKNFLILFHDFLCQFCESAYIMYQFLVINFEHVIIIQNLLIFTLHLQNYVLVIIMFMSFYFFF